MGGQAKARRTNPLTTTRARLDFQTTATNDRVSRPATEDSERMLFPRLCH